MSYVDKAYDALPAQETIGEGQWDETPEAAALRALFGTSAYRLLGDSGLSADRHLDGAIAIQEKIAQCYLFAREADRTKPVPGGIPDGILIDDEELKPITRDEIVEVTLAGVARDRVLRSMLFEILTHRDAMAPGLLRATRLYTDELGALRKRVAELEALNEAGARAVDALESIGEQARERIVDLASWLRYALEHWAPAGSDKAERARRLLDRAEAETPARSRLCPACDQVLLASDSWSEIQAALAAHRPHCPGRSAGNSAGNSIPGGDPNAA